MNHNPTDFGLDIAIIDRLVKEKISCKFYSFLRQAVIEFK